MASIAGRTKTTTTTEKTVVDDPQAGDRVEVVESTGIIPERPVEFDPDPLLNTTETTTLEVVAPEINYGGDGFDPDIHPEGVVIERGKPLKVKTIHNQDGTLTLQESIIRRVYPGGAMRPTYVILAAKGLTLMDSQLQLIANQNNRPLT